MNSLLLNKKMIQKEVQGENVVVKGMFIFRFPKYKQ